MSKILITEINAYNSEVILNKIQTEIKSGWDKGLLNTGERWHLIDADIAQLQESIDDYESLKEELEDAEEKITELENEKEKLEDKIEDLEDELEKDPDDVTEQLSEIREKYNEAIKVIEEIRDRYQSLLKENTILKNEVKLGKLKSAN